MTHIAEASRTELRRICAEIAKTQMWKQAPVPVNAIERVAAGLFKAAIDARSCAREMDDAILLRAARYIGRTHAIPAMGENTTWFFDMLQCLLEIATPNTEQDEEVDPFFQDLECGIAGTRAVYAQSKDEEPTT